MPDIAASAGIQTTGQLIQGLRSANPERRVTEATVRWPIRSHRIDSPPRFAGVYAWRIADVQALCAALGLRVPEGLAAIDCDEPSPTSVGEL